ALVPGEVAPAVLRRSIDVLVLEIQRRAAGAETLAVVDADNVAVVGVESVSAEERDRPTLVSDVGPAIEATGGGKARVHTATQTEVSVGLENDVDDARHSFRVILRR